MANWIISPRGEKRFALGHPWVFSNEITNSIKSVQPGELVTLTNQRGQTLALGYGNPFSLIAFRTLSRSNENIDTAWLARQLLHAARFRDSLQLTEFSHRLVFSEADNWPGLVIDCFKTLNKQQVFVLEILTAGVEKLFEASAPQEVFKAFLALAKEASLNYFPWEQTTLILKKDNSFRKMENLPQLETEIIGVLKEEELVDIPIAVARSLNKKEAVEFYTDLVHGQKTGFFLDQRSNIELLLSRLPVLKNKTVRVLDLFCYVGQWSAQIAAELQKRGFDVEITAVDASQKALQLAEKNATPYTTKFTAQRMDIVEKCQELPQGFFDIVICDPPALIKSKKDHPAGKNAYVKINTASMRSLKAPGVFMSCSCSQHLSDEDLVDVLTTATAKTRRNMNWVAKGQQGPDHPMRLEFPQGTYLNSWLGLAKEETP